MDVVIKEGCLLLQGVKFGKRIWRKTWVILFEPSAAGVGRLEMYDGGAVKFVRKGEKRVIRLADCLSVTPAPSETCPASYVAFYLNTTQRTYTLAGPVQDEWVPRLCEVAFQRNSGGGEAACTQQRDNVAVAMSVDHNDLYSTWNPGHYQVTVESSEMARRCRLSGSYLLSPERDALYLLDFRTGRPVQAWPYRFLRTFGQFKKGVTIEAGRRCQTGEGQFTFLSNQGPQIYRAIEEAIMHQSVQDLLSKATASLQEGSSPRQPPPAPSPDGRGRTINDGPSRGRQERSFPEVSRKNLALPALPTSTKPNGARLGSPTSPPEIQYATIKPQSKVTARPAPPKDFLLPAGTAHSPAHSPARSPTHTKQSREQVSETMDSDASTSSENPDMLYCNWGAQSASRQGISECEYSTVVRSSACSPDDSPSQTACSQQPALGSLGVPVNFKQTLSSILLKDLGRFPSPSPPRAHGGSSGCLS